MFAVGPGVVGWAGGLQYMGGVNIYVFMISFMMVGSARVQVHQAFNDSLVLQGTNKVLRGKVQLFT